MDALIIVDVQKDFCPGGAMEAPFGDKIVPVINEIMDQFDIIVASRDFHPPDTRHFDKWPPHCVQGTTGSDFHPDLNLMRIEKVFLKGTGKEDDGYSAFEATNADLEDYLKTRDVDKVYIVGLTTEYCIKNTVFDALKSGFKTFVIKDAVTAVNPRNNDSKKAMEAMKRAGAIVVRSEQIIPTEENESFIKKIGF